MKENRSSHELASHLYESDDRVLKTEHLLPSKEGEPLLHPVNLRTWPTINKTSDH